MALRGVAGMPARRSFMPNLRQLRTTARALSGCPLGRDDAAEVVRDASEIPGLKMWPLVNSLPTLLQYRAKDGTGMLALDLIKENLDKHGTVFELQRDRARSVYVVASPDYLKLFETDSSDIRGILDNLWSAQQFFKRNFPKQKLNAFLQRGEEWRSGRMAINPYIFNAKKAKSYLPQINQAVRAALPHIAEHEENLGDYFVHASVDMFNSVALGVNLEASAGDVEGLRITNIILEGVSQAFEVQRFAPYSQYDMLKFGAWRKFETAYGAMIAEISKIIDRSLADPKADGFLKDFLTKESGMTEGEASTMAAVLVSAAADTTSSLLFNIVFMLSRNPEAQSRLRAELQSELQGRDWQADSRCNYLNWVLYESQRMLPAIAINHAHNAIKHDVVIDGFRIPKDSNVFFSHHIIANSVDRPDEFLPERWSDEEKAKRRGTPMEFLDHPLVREPFGFGPRKCIGSRIALLEVRALISRLVQDYEFHFDAESSPAFENVATVSTRLRPSPHIRFRPTAAASVLQ